MLEVGSGTGQHAVACARALAPRIWRPTDPDPLHLGSIAAWAAEAALPNLAPPLALDATRPADWTAARAALAAPPAAIFSANVIHIAPFAVAEALLAEAGATLAPGGLLLLYGPFLEAGETAPSNRAFDASLRARDPAWGLRDTADLAPLAAAAGLAPARRIAMPANNLILAFARR